MIAHALKRLFRSRVSGIGVFLFGVIFSAVLCGLRAASEAELRSYDATYHNIPVKMTVTNLTGSRSDRLEAPGWVVDVFTGEVYSPYHFQKYTKDLQIRSMHTIDLDSETQISFLVGVTSVSLAKALLPENGGKVQWREGYDESVFAKEEFLCIVPENFITEEDVGEQITLHFGYRPKSEIWGEILPRRECEMTFRVVGTYTGDQDSDVFCPYFCVEQVYQALGQEREIDYVGATLSDNDLLDSLRADRKYWFAEPNPLGEKTQWGLLQEYYPYALDINDSLLVSAAATLQNSILVNRICAVLVFVLAAGAGLLVGFLVIRQQKREINLMRTMGTSQISIFGGYVFEQMLCLLAGTLIGGAYFLWKPVEQVGAFVGLYLIGLVISLVIFLRRNLLTTMKEDE